MKRSISAVIIFLCGAGVGAIITNQVVKKKYQMKAQKDIDEAREAFRANNRKQNVVQVVQQEIKTDEETSEVSKFAKSVLTELEYKEAVEQLSYNKISEKSKVVERPNDGDTINPVSIFDIIPYVITPEEFSNGPEEVPDGVIWETDTLFYYKDEILADSDGTPIEDIEGMVGNDALGSFGLYEDDSVFVRNERIHTDFEILLDDEKWSEKMEKEKPELIKERRPHEDLDDE